PEVVGPIHPHGEPGVTAEDVGAAGVDDQARAAEPNLRGWAPGGGGGTRDAPIDLDPDVVGKKEAEPPAATELSLEAENGVVARVRTEPAELDPVTSLGA